MKLLERQDIIDRLNLLLADAKGGSGHVVALSGEAGVGKTTLLRAFGNLAGKEARLLWGACEDLATPEPLGPLEEIARSAGWDLTAAIERGGRLSAFLKALDVFGHAGTTTLLVIEDLHWADDATIDFVRFLGRRIGGTNILLVLTARSDEPTARSRLRRALADIPADSLVRIDVPLLTENAVAELTRGLDGSEIYRLTLGNAFYVMELVRVGGGSLPASVQDAVLVRADRLSATSRSLLDAVSIFPRRAEMAIINAILGEGCLAGIEECTAAGMLTVSDGICSFRHEVARRAIQSALSSVQRRRLNAMALSALADAGAAVARLSHHANEAQDAAAVRKFAPIAAEDASRLGAHREAVEHFRIAIAHANTFQLDERRVLYERFAFESHLVGRTADAIAAQRSALELYRATGDRLGEGDSLRWMSRLCYLDGNRIDADRFGAEAVELLEKLPVGPELAMAYSNLSHLAMLGSSAEEAVRWGDKAIALAEPQAFDRPDILCHAYNNVGTALQWSDTDRARTLLDRSLELALANDFPEHAARTYTNRAWLEYNLLADRDAQSWLDAGIAYCVERDLDTWRDYMRAYLAEVYLRQGRWDAATAVAQLVQANDEAVPLARFPANLVLAKLRTRRGDPADDLIAELTAYLKTGTELQRLAPYAVLMAERAWLGVADKEVAMALLDKAASIATNVSAIPEVFRWRRTIGASEIPDDLFKMPPPYGALMAGDWQAVAQTWQALGAPYEQALSLIEGDGEAQRSALELFEALGATAASTKSRDILRKGGFRMFAHGPRATTRSNPWGLTKRQIGVLNLIERGRSNSEIAAALFISTKTVDHHISAILEKLDAKSRGEAAAFARDGGLFSK